MRKLLLIAIAVLTLASCKNKENGAEAKVDENLVTTANSNLAVYKGEFIYIADAAVLKGKDYIYGVTINDKMHELADKVAPVKRDEFDMVSVIVTGTLAKKPEGTEGWDEVLTIVDIVKVNRIASKPDVKLEAKNPKEKQTK